MDTVTNAALKDLSVVHKLCFAARSLPNGTPNYWKLISSFAIEGNNEYSLSPDEARVFVENLQVLHKDVFDSDVTLTRRLLKLPKNDTDKPEKIGVVLVSPKHSCPHCKSRLYLRSDRSVTAIIYDHHLGTIPWLHYTRYCRKQGCHYQQHYGYHTTGDSNEVVYDPDC